MSSSSSSDDGPGRREVAYRLFAAEFDDSEFDYSESDEERAPNYVVTPTGARVNRLFAVGVLTEVEDVNPEMVRGRVVGPTGAFVTYAGQYQPDALTSLERADPPTFLALSGKARTFEPDDGDRIYSSVRPESVSEVDAETRDRWVVTTAERTLERIGIMASAIEAGLVGEQLRAALLEAGVDERLADGVVLALDYYGTTPAYLDALRETALDALRVVAGEKDEVSRLDVAPDEGMGDASALATLDLSGAPSPETAAAAAGVSDAEPASEADDTDDAGESAETTESEAVSADTESTPAAEPSVSDTATSTESEPEPEQ
ncbi:MAG: RPA family protein, partial [Natronomonas sp.]